MWARAKARRAQRRYLRAHWLLLTVGVLLVVALVAALLLVVTDRFARGFLLGVALAGTLGAGAYWVLQVSGTAPTMMGDTAEQWTASELRRLQRGGWQVVNHLLLRSWDIDHVLVGPGGAFALETKWSAEPWVLDPPDDRVRRAARQAVDNARDLRLWTKFRRAGVQDVHPVVMLWGAGSAQLAAMSGLVMVEGAWVVPGPAADSWRATIPTGVLSPEQVDAAWQVLDAQALSRDTHHPTPLPASMTTLAGRALMTAVAAGLGFVNAAWVLRLTGSWSVWVAACLLLAVAAGPALRFAPARLPALGWQAGVAGTLAMGGVLAVLPHLL